jgi:hypothetical protein
MAADDTRDHLSKPIAEPMNYSAVNIKLQSKIYFIRYISEKNLCAKYAKYLKSYSNRTQSQHG